jgi:heme exporter protein B
VTVGDLAHSCDTPVAGSKTGLVGFLRHAGAVAAKDLRVELRSREILYTMAFFAAMVVLIFSFAFMEQEAVVAETAPGILWGAVLLAGTLGLSRAFDREREGETMRGLLLAPCSRTAIFAGKMLAIAALMLLVQVVAVPLVILWVNADFMRAPLPFLLIMALGTIGIAVVGTVFAAMLLRVRARDVLLPVVLYPILIPLLLATTRGVSALMGVEPNLAEAWFWIRFLLVYDAVFVIVSLWTFESLVIE